MSTADWTLEKLEKPRVVNSVPPTLGILTLFVSILEEILIACYVPNAKDAGMTGIACSLGCLRYEGDMHKDCRTPQMSPDRLGSGQLQRGRMS